MLTNMAGPCVPSSTQLVRRLLRSCPANAPSAQSLPETVAKRLALTDSLTGIANRRAFGQYAASLQRPTTEVAHGLAIIDVDHFKRVNDEHGHDVGDLVLQLISERLQAQISEVAKLARLGGEEFGVLVPATGRLIS